MAYDTALEERIDQIIEKWEVKPLKKKMFAGLGYIVNGNMAFGIHSDELIVRTSEEQGQQLLKQPGVKPFSMGHKTAMKNWYFAGGESISGSALNELLQLSLDFAINLPPK